MGGVLSSVKYTEDGIPYYTLNDFKELTRLGGGGEGIVQKGYGTTVQRSTIKKQYVAVKTFNRLDIYSEREIQLLKSHPHPHIIEIFGVIWENKMENSKPIYTGYVMEYMELGSLHDAIYDISYDYDMGTARKWIMQIGWGLQYLHDHDVMHRDIKPENILLAARDHLKLADFGLARNISGKVTSAPRGTEPYKAPEVGTSPDYGPPADVYSFGITIWEIIHRQRPNKNLKVTNDVVELPIDTGKMDDQSADLLKRCWLTVSSERPSVYEIIQFYTDFNQTVIALNSGKDANQIAVLNRNTLAWTISELELPEDNDKISGAIVCLYDVLFLIGGDRNHKKLLLWHKTTGWIRRADMNEARQWIKNSCVVWNDEIWVFGGRSPAGTCLKSIERYNCEDDEWMTELMQMKYARHSAAATIHDGKFYICGGKGENGELLTSVECIVKGKSAWFCEMSNPRMDHVMVSYGGKLILMGGHDGTSNAPSILELNLTERKWNQLSQRETSYSIAAVVVDHEIFTIGKSLCESTLKMEIFDGIQWRDAPSDKLEMEWYPFVAVISQEMATAICRYEKPEPETASMIMQQIKNSNINHEQESKQTLMTVLQYGTDSLDKIMMLDRTVPGYKWKLAHQMDFSVNSDAIGQQEGFLPYSDGYYKIGGGKSRKNLFKITLPMANQTKLNRQRLANMNHGRENIRHSCVYLNGFLWVFGGYKDRCFLKSVERYDTINDVWTIVSEMKYARANAAATVCNGKIIICGGQGDGDVLLNSVECFDPESGVWAELTSMPDSLVNHSLIYYKNMLVRVGGYCGPGQPTTSTVLAFNPDERNGQWLKLEDMNAVFDRYSAQVLDQEIFVFGRHENQWEVLIFNGDNWRSGPSFPLLDGKSCGYCLTMVISQDYADSLLENATSELKNDLILSNNTTVH